MPRKIPYIAWMFLAGLIAAALVGHEYRYDHAPAAEAETSTSHVDSTLRDEPVRRARDFAVAAVAARAIPALSAAEAETREDIRRMVRAKDDNDPRVDRDWKTLSPPLRAALVDDYVRTAPERRNERGWYAFLLARALESDADFAFLDSVLAEDACLSLDDCAKAPSAAGDAHLDSTDEVTLAYPQLVALRGLESRWKGWDRANRDRWRERIRATVLGAAEKSPVPRVRSEAQRVLEELKD